MQTFTDQMGNTIQLANPPVRIVSLVPSQTELLYHLGLDKEVVGQTLFCIHPKHQHETKPRVGGTKKLHLDKIRELKPDLIIGNKEENEQQQITELQKEFPVWMSDIKNLDDAKQMIHAMGEITGRKREAFKLVLQIMALFHEVENTNKQKAATIIYFIWRQPWMAAGKGTFIDDMLTHCGFENISGIARYPELSPAQIAALDPDIIFLSSEPFPFKEQHIDELKMICPGAHIRLVDGEMFSWYGSRLLKAAPYFKQLQSAILT